MAIFVGDTGTKIILDVGCDISSSTVRQIKYVSPTGKVGAWDASIEATQSISIVTQASTLKTAGRWILQAYVETSTWARHGEICNLEVSSVLGQ